MSSTTLPVCPKTGSTSPASQSIFAYTLLREIGNAPTRTGVMRLVLRRGVILTAAGTAIGLVGAAVITRLAESLLFEVAPLDPASLGSAAAVLAGVALAATWLPARRAAGVDPVEALRAE